MLPRLRSVYSGILFDSTANILQKVHHFSKAARARQGPSVETFLYIAIAGRWTASRAAGCQTLASRV